MRSASFIAGVGALLCAWACTATTDLDGLSSRRGESGGAGPTVASSTTSSGTQGGGGGSGGGTTSAGGMAMACGTCTDFVTDRAPLELLCGYSDTDGCLPNSSCSWALDLEACVCGGPGGQGGFCIAQCPLTCSRIGNDSNACTSCAETNCAPQLTACALDG